MSITDDYYHKDGTLDDEEDPQTDELEVDSTKESCDDDIEEPGSVSDKALEFFVSCWVYLKILTKIFYQCRLKIRRVNWYFLMDEPLDG